MTTLLLLDALCDLFLWHVLPLTLIYLFAIYMIHCWNKSVDHYDADAAWVKGRLAELRAEAKRRTLL